ncbi:MAG TPA: hypothetical protein VEY07_02450 [Thermoplasmata archaeon]|nr:hypothetical protein [Thermoplasmata archaeon]
MEVDGCELPEDRLYDLENDTWLKLEDGGRATVGLTQSIASFAGRFQSVSFRPVTGALARGRSIATIESVRFTGAVRIPVEGTVVERNTALVDRPKLLNDAPYGDGWVARIELSTPSEVGRTLESAGAIQGRLAQRIQQLRIRCLPAAPDVELYEIGSECSAVLARLSEEVGRRAPGEVVLLVTDDPTSPIEMVRWSDRTGHPVLAHRVDGPLHQFLVRRGADPHPRARPARASR